MFREILTALFVVCLVVPLHGQILEPAGQTQNGATNNVDAIYRLTKTAKTTADFSTIVELCDGFIADSKADEKDRSYATKLKSWALNRRGNKTMAACEALKSVGNQSESDSHFERAVADFKMSLNLDSSRWRAHFGLGNAYAFAEKYVAAVEHYSKALELKPTFTSAMFNRAEVNARLGEHDLAIADYSIVINSDQADTQALTGRGLCYFQKREYGNALKDLQRVQRLMPKNSTVCCNLGDIWMLMGETQKAVEQYKLATTLSSPAIGHERLGNVYVNSSNQEYFDPAKGVAEIQNAIKLTGESSKLLKALAAGYSASGDEEMASQMLEKAESMSAGKGLAPRVAEQPSKRSYR